LADSRDTRWKPFKNTSKAECSKAPVSAYFQPQGAEMAQNNAFVCPVCGHVSKEHRHGMNKTLIFGLQALHNAGGTARLENLHLDNLTKNTNFQKLQYFGLAMRVGHNREWGITTAGKEFLFGCRKVHKFVITRNSIVIRKSEKMVFMHEIKDCIQYKAEWEEYARMPGLFDQKE
jgi:hypothetical protein